MIRPSCTAFRPFAWLSEIIVSIAIGVKEGLRRTAKGSEGLRRAAKSSEELRRAPKDCKGIRRVPKASDEGRVSHTSPTKKTRLLKRYRQSTRLATLLVLDGLVFRVIEYSRS